MTEFNWSETTNRLAALREEIEGDDHETEQVDEETEELEGLSLLHLHALAEMLGVDAEALLEADEEMLESAMMYLGYQVIASSAKYGRSGMTGKYPWDRNEGTVGVATPHAAPTKTGDPGTKSAEVPYKSSSPMSQKGTKHRMK
jgi:hypothetical protein